MDVLVDEDRDAVALLQHPHHAADRALTIDDRVACTLTDALEHRVEALVIERARQHANRLEAERVRDGVQLPEPEMAGDEQHALPLRVGKTHPLLAVELDAREHLWRSARAELERFEGLPDEVYERGADNRAPFG